MSGHTPGPWQQRDDMTSEGWVTIIGNVDGEIDADGCTFHSYDVIAVCEDEYGERLPNVSANARLIAAAPELLEALEDTLSTLEHTRRFMLEKHGTKNPAREDAIAKARAAIAKARGAA